MSFVPRSKTTDKLFFGVEEGVVTSVDDSRKEGHVKVKLVRRDDQMELECRVCHPYAGNDYGYFFIPEKGDEVLVAFIQGDMRIPVILGGLYNGQDKPPTFRAADKDQKMIRTKGKHEILLDDTQGHERVRIKTKDGNEVDLSDEKKKVTVTTASGDSLELNYQDKKVTLKTAAGPAITLNGQSGSITISGPTTVTLDAASINLGTAASQPLILGNAFMALFNAHTHNLGPAVTTPPVTPMLPVMLSTVSKTS